MQYIADRITVSPDLCNGKPTIRGMRITVQTILEFLLAGDKVEDILTQYPFLENADIEACKNFAIELMDKEFSLQPFESKAA